MSTHTMSLTGTTRRTHALSRRWIGVLVVALLTGGCSQIKETLGLSSKPAQTPAPAPVESVVLGPPAPEAAPATAAKSSSAAGASQTPRRTAHSKTATPPAAPSADAPVPSTPEAPKAEAAATPSTDTETAALPARSASAATPTRAPVAGISQLPLNDERSPIYSEADRDVTPAKLLTTQTGGPVFRNGPADTNTMELVISKLGRVEQVKLTSPTKRMTDMLLLSGAKTWKFTPAIKDGVPVRYRTRFSWETVP